VTNEADLVQALVDNPDDRGLALVLEDFWQDLGRASPVRRNHLPNWLRLAWLRKVRVARSRYGGTKNMHLVYEIDHFLRENGLRKIRNPLDRWGSTVIAARLCFVTELRVPLTVCRSLFRPLGILFNSAWGASPVSHWNPGVCCRAVLFPPKVMPPKRTRSRKESRA